MVRIMTNADRMRRGFFIRSEVTALMSSHLIESQQMAIVAGWLSCIGVGRRGD